MKRALTILAVFAALALPARATVDLTLYNSFPLLDNASQPLEGTSSAGDLVQLILAGPNGIIDTPSGSGAPGGDDTILFTTHVGAGLPSVNSGLLAQSSILFANTLIGSNAYVRFWDSNTAANSGYYGVSGLFTLPAGDSFGLAELDFAPSSGSSRTAGTAFSAESAVPEPSELFLIGLLILGVYFYWKRRRRVGAVVAFALLLAASRSATAQVSPPLDVTASASILNATGSVLAGDNPVNGNTNQCVVQILSVGANGVADLPNLDGTPGGDDTVIATTVIGQGIAPGIVLSGKFSTSFYLPSYGDGAKIYARVFDAPTPAAATHFGQSATFTINGATVFDLTVLGLQRTPMPKGVDLQNTVDSKGLTYYQEFVANTDPNDPSDYFAAGQITTAGQVSVRGRAGRQYFLQRTLDLSAPSWGDVSTTSRLNADANLILSDPNPPFGPKAFYRVRVIMP